MISMAVITSALELGLIYALVALALYLSFRVLNIADMTTDGSFTLGCAVSAVLAVAGHPYLALPAAMAAGACAGIITALLQTRCGVPSILAGRLSFCSSTVAERSGVVTVKEIPVIAAPFRSSTRPSSRSVSMGVIPSRIVFSCIFFV